MERAVLLTLKEDVFEKEASKQVASGLREYAAQQKKNAPSAIREKKKRLAAVERELKNYVDAIGSGLYTKEIGEKIKILDAERSVLLAELEYYKTASEAAKLSAPEIASYLQSFSGILEMPPEQQKIICRRFIDRVIVHENSIEIVVTPWERAIKRPQSGENVGFYGGGEGN